MKNIRCPHCEEKDLTNYLVYDPKTNSYHCKCCYFEIPEHAIYLQKKLEDQNTQRTLFNFNKKANAVIA